MIFRKRHSKKLLSIGMSLMLLVLTACGGGSGSPSAGADTQNPVSETEAEGAGAKAEGSLDTAESAEVTEIAAAAETETEGSSEPVGGQDAAAVSTGSPAEVAAVAASTGSPAEIAAAAASTGGPAEVAAAAASTGSPAEIAAAAASTGSPAEVAAEADIYEKYRPAADLARGAMEQLFSDESHYVYVYKDFGDTENHFTQKAKMFGRDDFLVKDMNENWTDNPWRGSSCIRCEQTTLLGDWGGWLFLNGFLPEGSSEPQLNDGSAEGQGLDLSSATELRFYARGEEGGEAVEFFTCGFGYKSETGERTVPYPDSSQKLSLGTIELTTDWQEYRLDLTAGYNLSYIVCGFGYVLSGGEAGEKENVFYLDDIAFSGDFESGGHYMLRSYDTDNIYIKNAAFSYDNALAAMAFISDGEPEKAQKLLDSFVYAVENDRYLPGRVRNAYASGDITAFPGWNDAARLPGWYDNKTGEWYEDRYQTGSNVGNTSYVALALLQYDALYGNEKYVETAKALMDWVIENCSDSGYGFTGGYDGWPEGGNETTYPFTYKSIEHNIDAYAAFRRLFVKTGDERYKEAAASAFALIASMYDEEKGLFYTGTRDDGVTPSKDNTVLDAQVWAWLALQDRFEPYMDALKIVDKMETKEGGYPFCAANVNGGWWAEGTAYTALMYRLLGDEQKADSALEALEKIQLESGLFPAATVDNLSTGFGLFDGSPWEYSTAPHLAPTAWFVMAVNGFNPYTFDQ